MCPNNCSPSPFDCDIHCRIQKGTQSGKCWSVPFQAFMSRPSIFLMFHSMFILFISYFLLFMISPQHFFSLVFSWACEKPLGSSSSHFLQARCLEDQSSLQRWWECYYSGIQGSKVWYAKRNFQHFSFLFFFFEYCS